jgi:hypothetical protein
MNNGRRAPRRDIRKAGSINFAGTAITCIVSNISKTGAALDVIEPAGIPDTFILKIEFETAERGCRVVWRKLRRLGVVFEG